MTWWSGWRVVETYFSGQNWTQKPQNYPKIHISWTIRHKELTDHSKLPQDLLYYQWSEICIPLRWPEVPPKMQFSVSWGFIMTKLHDFPYFVNHRSNKVGWPLKMTARMDLLWVLYDIHTPHTTENTQKVAFLFFRALIDEISKVFISQELYIILNWLNF